VGTPPLVRPQAHANSWVEVPTGEELTLRKQKATASLRSGVGSGWKRTREPSDEADDVKR